MMPSVAELLECLVGLPEDLRDEFVALDAAALGKLQASVRARAAAPGAIAVSQPGSATSKALIIAPTATTHKWIVAAREAMPASLSDRDRNLLAAAQVAAYLYVVYCIEGEAPQTANTRATAFVTNKMGLGPRELKNAKQRWADVQPLANLVKKQDIKKNNNETKGEAIARFLSEDAYIPRAWKENLDLIGLVGADSCSLAQNVASSENEAFAAGIAMGSAAAGAAFSAAGGPLAQMISQAAENVEADARRREARLVGEVRAVGTAIDESREAQAAVDKITAKQLSEALIGVQAIRKAANSLHSVFPELDDLKERATQMLGELQAVASGKRGKENARQLQQPPWQP